MIENKFISVVVATYRRKNSLILAIESIQKQTYPSFEIVLVDDNADIAWNKIVKEIASRFDSIIYIQNKINRGSAITRNIGVAAASGEYITFLDDDDVYLPEKISHQISAMKLTGSDYSVTDLMLYNKNNKLIETRKREGIKSENIKELMEYHLKYHITGTDTFMFKKTYLDKIGGFPEIDIGDEFYLMANAITGGGVFQYISGCNVKAYIHSGEEGLSSGQAKIDGENRLFSFKSGFNSELDKSTRKYIKMRHYAVLAYSRLRMKQYGGFIKNLATSIYSSPVGFVNLIVRRY